MNKQSKTGLLIGNKTLGVKKLKALLSGATLLTFAGLLASCSNESEPQPQVLDDSNPVLTLYVPNNEALSSRATYDASQDEAGVDDIWLYAYPTDDATKAKYESSKQFYSKNIKDLKQSNNGYTGYADYAQYNVTDFKSGEYKIYVLANLANYINDSDLVTKYNAGTLSETEIAGIVLKFQTSQLPLPGTRALPMACYYDEVKSGTSSTNATILVNNKYTFNATSNPLYIDLTLLCAKVRYTILFNSDTTDTKAFSTDFGNGLVDFEITSTNTTASNLIPEVAYKTGSVTNTTVFNDVTLVLGKAAYPEDNSAYLDIENQSGSSITLLDLGTGSWDASAKKRAWQGTVYLPENPTTVEGNASKISFTPTSSSASIKSTPEIKLFWNNIGIQRGYFYDVVVKVTQPGEMGFVVNVKVKPWNYEGHEETW